MNLKKLSTRDVDRIIEMAWEDRTPFGAIKLQFGVSESEVIRLMRKELKSGSFKAWRQRVQNRKTKHRDSSGFKFKSDRQRNITGNRISKR